MFLVFVYDYDMMYMNMYVYMLLRSYYVVLRSTT